MSARRGDSPFEILGIRPSASLEEAEAAYRARLRRWHPDLHAHAGPDAVARAEERTRELNAAIHALRAGARVHAGATTGGASAWSGGFPTDDTTDWFGNPLDDRPRLRCVFCDVTIREAKEYRAHLLLDHAWVDRRRARRLRPPRLAWLPAPTLWSLIVVVFYWSVVFAVLGDSALAMALWWSGVVGYILFLPVAYRAERYRRRF